MILSATGQGSIGIPSPATIVRDATSITLGTFEPDGSEVRFRPIETLKGPKLSPKGIAVATPGPIMGFDLADTARQRSGGRVLLFGSWDDERQRLVLPWYFGSIWPPTVGFSTFPSATLEGCLQFVQTVLGYHHLAEDGLAPLLEALLTDAQGPKRYAALDFMDVSLNHSIKSDDRLTRRHVVWSGFVAATADRQSDKHLDELLPSLLPVLPASQAIPWLLEHDGTQTGVVRVQRLLGARGIPVPDRPLSREGIERLFREHQRSLRIKDAEFALSMFDSPFPLIRDRFSDRVLERILGKPLSELTNEAPPKEPGQRKELWRKLIRRL
jgi:hypothetical protein